MTLLEKEQDLADDFLDCLLQHYQFAEEDYVDDEDFALPDEQFFILPLELEDEED